MCQADDESIRFQMVVCMNIDGKFAANFWTSKGFHQTWVISSFKCEQTNIFLRQMEVILSIILQIFFANYGEKVFMNS